MRGKRTKGLNLKRFQLLKLLLMLLVLLTLLLLLLLLLQPPAIPPRQRPWQLQTASARHGGVSSASRSSWEQGLGPDFRNQ